MSLGYSGIAHKCAEDDHTVIYNYGGINLNDPRYRNENHLCDGAIMIDKVCFPEPEIHEWIRKMPSGKKKLVRKRVPIALTDIPFDEYFTKEQIIIENCSNCWKASPSHHFDYIALHLLFIIFDEYQVTGEIPQDAYYVV